MPFIELVANLITIRLFRLQLSIHKYTQYTYICIIYIHRFIHRWTHTYILHTRMFTFILVSLNSVLRAQFLGHLLHSAQVPVHSSQGTLFRSTATPMESVSNVSNTTVCLQLLCPGSAHAFLCIQVLCSMSWFSSRLCVYNSGVLVRSIVQCMQSPGPVWSMPLCIN